MEPNTVHPGRGVGPYTLGEKISHTLRTLRTLSKSGLEVIFPETPNAEGKAIVLSLTEEAVEFTFDVSSQRLVSISITRPESTELLYQGVAFSGDSVAPTFATVYRTFGPTFPGRMEGMEYLLGYPGMTVVFGIPEQLVSLYQAGDKLPMEFPDGTTPLASRLMVHYPTPTELCTNEAVTISLDHGMVTVAAREAQIELGASPQKVHLLLGAPDSVCHKPGSEVGTEYIYNYFSLGIDLIFNGSTHRVTKVTPAPSEACDTTYVSAVCVPHKPTWA